MSETTTAQAEFEALRTKVHGEVLRPGDRGYDESRSVWNAQIDREPGVIVRCNGAADVMAAVDFARDEGVDLAVKGGGHHIAGHAVCDDGVVIDLAPMNGVRVDPQAQTVSVEGGALWGDVNHELHAFDLDIVGMPYPEVGVGGFTLGGGMAGLSRKYGLAIDNLRAVDIVTAEGELVHASEGEYPDLFWGIRGGGGNFGVVTAFEFDCHEVRPKVLYAELLHPIEDAVDVLRYYRDFMEDAPPEVTAGAGLHQIPSEDAYPAELQGEPAVALAAYYLGDVMQGENVLQPLMEFGDTLHASLEETHLEEAGTEIAAGKRNHWKSHFFAELSDAAIETFVEEGVPLPNELTGVHFFSLGGAINDVDPEATAYPHRDATHLLEIPAQWSDPEDDETVIGWAREFHEAMAPYATGGEYSNNQTDESDARVQAAYGRNYDRLLSVKNEWDQENLFSMNQNIRPTNET